MDNASRYFLSHGYEPEPAMLVDSQYQIGWSVTIESLSLIYRLEGASLIICHIATQGPGDGQNAIFTFMYHVRQLLAAGSGIHDARGTFFSTYSQPQVNALRQRLMTVLEQQGAQWQDYLGEPWLVYTLPLN